MPAIIIEFGKDGAKISEAKNPLKELFAKSKEVGDAILKKIEERSKEKGEKEDCTKCPFNGNCSESKKEQQEKSDEEKEPSEFDLASKIGEGYNHKIIDVLD
jgi:hypothetical protein